MRHLVVVTKLQRLEQDETGITGFFFVVVRLLYNPIKQFTTVHTFCDQIVILLFVKHIVETNNVRMLEFAQYGNLVVQSRFVFGCQFSLGNNLDRVRAAQLFVRPFFDHAKGTGSELPPCGVFLFLFCFGIHWKGGE
jgi:hypothetical protein